MQTSKHLYSFNYDHYERDLCKLEAKNIFNQEDKNKLLFSDVLVTPSSSAFIKNRLDILAASEDYPLLIKKIKELQIKMEGFKVEYYVFGGDETPYAERLNKLKDIGYSIEGYPDYHHPDTTYALCLHYGIWYFGLLTKNKYAWQKHKEKPWSYSNSISTTIAKSLVNIATNGNKENTLLDACCGVGTIMLEACFAGYSIEGCEINPKVCKNARENLAHFNYTAKVHFANIGEMKKNFDSVIVDLPYNLFSIATENDLSHIIESAAKINKRMVIASGSNVSNHIEKAGFHILDQCFVGKRGKKYFARQLWVCEKYPDQIL